MAVQMNASSVNTFEVPLIGSRQPATVTKASKVPLRVVLRNIGVVNIFVAHTSLELSKVGATTGVFVIPPGFGDTFVVAPEQGLYVAAAGAIGRACAAISEAWPTFMEC